MINKELIFLYVITIVVVRSFKLPERIDNHNCIWVDCPVPGEVVSDWNNDLEGRQQMYIPNFGQYPRNIFKEKAFPMRPQLVVPEFIPGADNGIWNSPPESMYPFSDETLSAPNYGYWDPVPLPAYPQGPRRSATIDSNLMDPGFISNGPQRLLNMNKRPNSDSNLRLSDFIPMSYIKENSKKPK